MYIYPLEKIIIINNPIVYSSQRNDHS